MHLRDLQRVIWAPPAYMRSPLSVVAKRLASSDAKRSDSTFDFVLKMISSTIVPDSPTSLSCSRLKCTDQSVCDRVYPMSLKAELRVIYHCRPACFNPYNAFLSRQNPDPIPRGFRRYISSSSGP